MQRDSKWLCILTTIFVYVWEEKYVENSFSSFFFHSSDLSKKEKKNYSLNIDRLEIRNLRSTRKVNLNRATWHLNLGPMH